MYEVIGVSQGVPALTSVGFRGVRGMKVLSVGSCEGMVDSKLKSCRSLMMMVDGFFTAHMFGGFGRLPPEGVVMGRWAVNECVRVREMPGDSVIGTELLNAECPLVL